MRKEKRDKGEKVRTCFCVHARTWIKRIKPGPEWVTFTNTLDQPNEANEHVNELILNTSL